MNASPKSAMLAITFPNLGNIILSPTIYETPVNNTLETIISPNVNPKSPKTIHITAVIMMNLIIIARIEFNLKFLPPPI